MVLFLIGIIVSIPVAIAANFLTPYLQTRWARRSSSRKQKRVNELKAQAREVSEHHDGSSTRMVAYSTRYLTAIVANFVSAAIFVTAFLVGFITNGNAFITSFCAIIGIIFLFAANYSATRFQRSLRNVEHFKQYKVKVNNQIIRLGGSTDDVWPAVNDEGPATSG